MCTNHLHLSAYLLIKVIIISTNKSTDYGKIMRCALFEILYLTEVYLVTD
jgi:hypothetical protein